jgi:outer membrane receptor protein involved in Fe transport
MEILTGKLSADLSVYHLEGNNEIINVKLDDGSYTNQNAGKTSHQGIEFGIKGTATKTISFRLSGAFSRHTFTRFVEKGITYDGNRMNNAPNWIYNAEAWYRPAFIKGLRLGTELQHVGSYYVDPLNTSKYGGYDVLNLRAGYTIQGVEVWLNILNVTNNYFSYITTKSSFGYSYQLAEPLNFNLGLSYDFGKLFKHQ